MSLILAGSISLYSTFTCFVSANQFQDPVGILIHDYRFCFFRFLILSLKGTMKRMGFSKMARHVHTKAYPAYPLLPFSGTFNVAVRSL